MSFAICCVPVSPLRSEPSHKSEMVSQLIFGEYCSINEQKNEWVKIKCKYDGYEGWCQLSHINEIEKEEYDAPANLLAAEWCNKMEYNNQPMMIPFGSNIDAFTNGYGYTKNNGSFYSGKIWDTGNAAKNEESILQIAFQFLNTSYLWGGKSVFGIDCSGFTQTVFKFFKIELLRDAWQQATQGGTVESLSAARFGDLIFFDNNEGRVTHVGILLNNNEIIHASGKVRVDKIDEEGIINTGNGQRTHHLKIIKRYF
jgi:gamma-D-glutamyl-L-lysine dipeptidyl-peptidase